jgi:hypothetical protein
MRSILVCFLSGCLLGLVVGCSENTKIETPTGPPPDVPKVQVSGPPSAPAPGDKEGKKAGTDSVGSPANISK